MPSCLRPSMPVFSGSLTPSPPSSFFSALRVLLKCHVLDWRDARAKPRIICVGTDSREILECIRLCFSLLLCLLFRFALFSKYLPAFISFTFSSLPPSYF